MAMIKGVIAATPRQFARRPTELHKSAGIPLDDPDSVIRDINTTQIFEELKREQQVNRVFAVLENKLCKGQRVLLDEPVGNYCSATKWDLFSNQCFSRYLLNKIDKVDFESWSGPPSITFRRLKGYTGSDGMRFDGYISGLEGMLGVLKPFKFPKYASLDPIVIKTTGRSREVTIWFAEAGYMRMEMTMGSKEDIRNGKGVEVIWSGIQNRSERKDWPHKVFEAKEAKLQKRRKRKEEKMAAANKKKAEEEQAAAREKADYEYDVARCELKIKRWTARCEAGRISPAQLEAFIVKLETEYHSDSETGSEDEFYDVGRTDGEDIEEESDHEEDSKNKRSVSPIWSESSFSSAGQEAWSESDSEWEEEVAWEEEQEAAERAAAAAYGWDDEEEEDEEEEE